MTKDITKIAQKERKEILKEINDQEGTKRTN